LCFRRSTTSNIRIWTRSRLAERGGTCSIGVMQNLHQVKGGVFAN
jgi:hypothetical protein